MEFLIYVMHNSFLFFLVSFSCQSFVFLILIKKPTPVFKDLINVWCLNDCIDYRTS